MYVRVSERERERGNESHIIGNDGERVCVRERGKKGEREKARETECMRDRLGGGEVGALGRMQRRRIKRRQL